MKNLTRNIALWMIIALLIAVLFTLFAPSSQRGVRPNVAYSEFLTEIDAGHVRAVVMRGSQVSGTLTDGHSFQTYAPEDRGLIDRLTSKGVHVTARPEEADDSLLRYALSWLPMVLLVGVVVAAVRAAKAPAEHVLTLHRARAGARGRGRAAARLWTRRHGRVKLYRRGCAAATGTLC